MHKNWMAVCFVVAMLIISLAPLSSATCPWVIRNELYSAQCGVIKEVPASSGILVNDPDAMAVLKPEEISIDPEYGTIKVEADGSFFYDPSPNIQTGTYVTFQYNATNGACDAENSGSAKILVSCTCRPNVTDITLHMPKDLDEVEAEFIAAGAGCWECVDNTPVFDLSLVELLPGTYPYLLKCQDCTAVTGLVTITGMCQAYAPDITLCEGEVALAELLEMIDENAECIGQDRDQSFAINVDNVAVEDGFVTGGSYMVTCGLDPSCSPAWGTVTAIDCPKGSCTSHAPDVCVCKDASIGDIEAKIESLAECRSCGPDLASDLSRVMPGSAGTYEYTLKYGEGTGCPASEDTGSVRIMDKELSYRSDLGTYPVYMDKTTLVGNAHVEITGGDLVITVETPGITMTASDFRVETTPIADCSTGSDWDQLGGGETVVYTKPLSKISGLTCGSTLYIGVRVDAPDTAWAKGGCGIKCESGSGWAYGICINPICEQICTCDP